LDKKSHCWIEFMKTNNSVRMIGGVAVAVATLLVAAQAQATVVWSIPAGLAGNDLSGNSPNTYYEVGNEFTVVTAGSVTSVGMFDYGHDGFSANIPVAIFEQVGSSWAQVSGTYHLFSSGAQSGTYDGDATFYTLPTPVTLNPGVYAIVAGGGGTTADPYWNSTQPNPGSSSPTFNSVGGMLAQNTQAGYYLTTSGTDPGLAAWPSIEGAWTFPYGAATFDFTPVPEVATFGAAAVGLLGLVYAARQVRIRRKTQGV
jgi:hypothetical protein